MPVEAWVSSNGTPFDFLHTSPLGPHILQSRRHSLLRIGEQVRISVRYVDGLMPYSIGDVGRAVSHVDQDGDMAVSKVVHANPLNSSYLAASFHLLAEVALGESLEDPLVIRNMEEEPDILLDLLSQEPRYPESPV